MQRPLIVDNPCCTMNEAVREWVDFMPGLWYNLKGS